MQLPYGNELTSVFVCLYIWGKNKEATRVKRMFLLHAKLRMDNITDASKVMSRITSAILVTFF